MISTSRDQLWIDLHCHLFNARDIPVVGFVSATRDRRQAVAADWATRGAPSMETDLRLIERLLDLERIDPEKIRIPGGSLVGGYRRMRYAATRSRITSLRVLDGICSDHPDACPGTEVRTLVAPDDQLAPVDLYVPLCVDMGPKVDDDHRRHSPLDQLTTMSALSAATMFAGVIPDVHGITLPMVGYHPSRQEGEARNDLARVTQAVCDGRAIGVKLYPAMGFTPTGNGGAVQASLDCLYEWAAEKRVPIVAHASRANAVDGHERSSHPEGSRPVLERHGDLRLCLAHSGGLDAPTWVYAAARLATDFPFVYCDVSNHDLVARGPELVTMLLTLAANEPTRAVGWKSVFGSDYWFLLERPGFRDFLTEYAEIHRTVFPEFYPRFSGGNARCFLGFDDATNPNNIRVRHRIATWCDEYPDLELKPVVSKLIAGISSAG